ncbi:MAG: porin [Planctomycetota bacterium]
MKSEQPIVVIAALMLLLASAEARPSDPEDGVSTTEARLRELEAKLSRIEQDEDAPSWFVGYDKGFVFRSTDMEKNPFALKINGRMQFRYTNFQNDEDDYVNRGTFFGGPPFAATDIDERSDFEIERGRLEFAGTFWDPRMHFYINIDADTDDNHRAIFHDFWMNYEFNEAFDLHFGKAFVPGSREWLDGSTRTHLADRSMATTFFRPDRSVGVWAIGQPSEGFHYRAMIGNGFNTTDLSPGQMNDEPIVSGSVWFEPCGDFGKGYADIQAENETRTRFGASLTWGREDGTASNGVALAESNFLRLDDGTRLTSLGVTRYDLTLLAVDAALKSGGFGLHGELYYRWLNRIKPTGPFPAFPERTNRSWGFYTTAGYMVVPEEIEVVVSTSTVQGRFKDSWEYAFGGNYFVDGTHKNKLTLDFTLLDGSPAQNSGPGFVAGYDGWLIRLQYQIAF